MTDYPAPPGMMYSEQHGFCFNHVDSHAAADSFKKDKKAYLKRILEAEVLLPAEVQVLEDSDEESVDSAVRCHEVGPKRAIPIGWVYDPTTFELKELVWTKYDLFRVQHWAKELGKPVLILPKPREETIERDMKAWYQKKWRCKPF